MMQADKSALIVPGASQTTARMSQITVLVDESAHAPQIVADALMCPSGAGNPALSLSPLNGAEALRDAGGALSADPDAHLLIVYQQPAEALSGDLDRGAEALQLDGWIEEAEGLLGLYRSYRRQVTLVDGNAALANPPGLAQLLLDRFGGLLSIDDLGGEEKSYQGIGWLIADFALRSDEKASRLLPELVASSLPIPRHTHVEVSGLIAQWRDGGESCVEVQSDIAKEIEKAADEGLAEENELLVLQLHQVQEELEHYYVINKNLEQEVASLKKELDWKREDIDNLYRSMSWKLTAPLRKVLDLVSRGK